MPHLLRFAALAALCVACRCAPSSDDPDGVAAGEIDVVAAIEEADAVRVVHRHAGGSWETFRELPAQARALRFSRDGRHVAWILDLVRGDEPVMVGYLWRDGAAEPRKIGVLGFGVHHAAGWDVGDDGRLVYVDDRGRLTLRLPDGNERDLGLGSDAVFGEGDALAYRAKDQPCLVVPEDVPCLSGSLVRPFAFAGTTLWAQSEQRLAIGAPGRREFVDAQEPLAVRPGPDGRTLVLRREHLADRSLDEVAVVEHGVLRELHEAPIIHAADWSPEGRVLLVRASSRRSVYDLLLAHAHEAHGGEMGAGEAVELDPSDGTIRPVAGLEGGRVRTIRRTSR